KNMPPLYKEIGRVYQSLEDWSMFLITGYEDAERYIGRKADKNRKIYNGMMQTRFYSFMGKKPGRK
ncbi:MAG: class I SAM-dependent RNA methyltransferase, partial [Lachnospiraceae bacterium]|nr:class I SAM-dependent RNA methyltransferase [Lachnospiraceae bacterium]